MKNLTDTGDDKKKREVCVMMSCRTRQGNHRNWITAAILLLALLVTLTGCSGKKKDALQIFSAENNDAYMEAAKNHFSSVGWSNADYTEEAHQISREYNGGTATMTFGGIRDDTRYVIVISEDEAILDSVPVEGKRFTAFVYDNGSDDIKITMCYCVGTTDNCVVKGNVTSGEFAYTNDISIAASEITDVSKRAGLLFDGLYKAFVDVEGK